MGLKKIWMTEKSMDQLIEKPRNCFKKSIEMIAYWMILVICYSVHELSWI